MVMKVKFGYAKVSREDAADGKYGPRGLRIRRLVESAWVFDEIRRRLLEGASPRLIIEWLKAEAVPSGKYAKQWTPKLFRDLLCDPILHGTRTFRDVVHQQIYKTGKYRYQQSKSPGFPRRHNPGQMQVENEGT